MKAKTGRRLGTFSRLAALYSDMDEAYARYAKPLGFTCRDCPNNCCDSFFAHHTYVEWAYLWQGLDALKKDERDYFLNKAREVVEVYRQAIIKNERPQVMCPLNEGGLCKLYDYRLMICRMHGTAHYVMRPDMTVATYPGCFRYEELSEKAGNSGRDVPFEEIGRKIPGTAPILDRTPLYRRLAEIEHTFLGRGTVRFPRVSMTIAEMMVMGRPDLKNTSPDKGVSL